MDAWKKKISLIGSDGVGKTSIIIRYTKGTFSNSYLMTLGCDFYEVNKRFMYKNDESSLDLFVWDIASQKSFEKIRSHYLQHTNFAIIVVDVNRADEDFISPWIKDLKANSPTNCPYIIVVNKSDLVETDEIAKIVENLKNKYKDTTIFYSSAKTGKNIHLIFDYITNFLIDEIKEI
ncbi:MAG: Rab family GTPase [Promethearchaeota archaeon]